MIDFMLELEKVLKIWPDNVKWNLVQLAELTNSKTPHVVEYISDALSKTLDVHEPMTFNEVSAAFTVIAEKNRAELDARKRLEERKTRQVIDSYYVTMDKISAMEITKNWRGAYRTLSYFFGLHKDRLPTHMIISLCNECLRLGIKANINYQENAQWLTRGIQSLMAEANTQNIEDALDFLDAYGEYFLNGPRGKGEQFITNLFLTLKPSAMEFDLIPKFNEVAGELDITSVMDVVI